MNNKTSSLYKQPESNENNYYNYVALFFWLYENTKINNESLLKPVILKQEFLKAFPNYNITPENENKYLNINIGKCLNFIYGNEIQRTKLFNSELRKTEMFYNLELLPETPENKAIYINNKRWLK